MANRMITVNLSEETVRACLKQNREDRLRKTSSRENKRVVRIL